MPARARIGLVAAALVVAACDDQPRGRLVQEGLPRGIVSGEYKPAIVSDDVAKVAWTVSSPALRSPFAFYALGDTLGIIVDRAPPFMHLVNLRRATYLWPLVITAEDPVEAFNVHRIAPSPHDPLEFMGYDMFGSTLTTFRVGNQDKPVTVVRTLMLKSPEAIDGVVWHRDGRISVEPVRDSSLRAFVLPDGGLSEPSGMSLATLAQDWVTPGAARDAMEGQTCASPNRSKLARAFQFSGRLLVLDSLGQEINEKREKTFFDPQFIVHETGEVVFDQRGNLGRLAYRWCGATRQFIFALYSGSLSRSSTRTPEPYARQVHVYDWNGVLRGGFYLQRSALSLDVTPDGKWLVALEGARDPSLVAYEVPKRFRGR